MNRARFLAMLVATTAVLLIVVGCTNPFNGEQYYVHYHGNGITDGADYFQDPIAYRPGQTVHVLGPGTLVRTGYTLTGWNSASDGTGTEYAPYSTFTMDSDDVHLFAQWIATPTYTVTYDGNDATSGMPPVDAVAYEEGDVVTVAGQGTLTWPGHTFIGWNTSETGAGSTYAPGSTFFMGNEDVILYALWTEEPTYNVTYDGNGNTGGTPPVDANNYLAGDFVTVASAGTLVRDGFSFDGWNTMPDGSGLDRAPGAIFQIGSADVALYAQWTITPTYTITYDGNGATSGTVPVDTNSYETGALVTVAGQGSLLRTGYTFIGWNTQPDGSGTNRAAGTTFIIGSSDVTLHAQWTLIPTYTVTYDANGADGGDVPVDTNNYVAGATVMVAGAGALTRTGHVFGGWNTLPDGSGVPRVPGSTFTMGAGDVTLYAQWNPTHTVTYDGNGNTSGTAPVDTNEYEENDLVTVAGQGTLLRTSYTFVGWNTQSNGLGTSRAAGTTFLMGAADVVLYAQWSANPTYTVTYDGNGNDGGSPPVDDNNYEQGQTVTVAGPGSLSLTSHTFVGWNTEADGSGTPRAVGSTFAMGSDHVTLFAQWSANPTYTVTYDGNGNDGGSPPVDDNNYEEGSPVTVLGPNTLSLTGYEFAGWDTDPGGGDHYDPDDILTMGSDDVTLYAQWNLIPTYTVTYDGNENTGGEAPTDTNQYQEGQTVIVSGPGTLARLGYEFTGWNVDPGGGGVHYDPDDHLIMGTEDVTLFAQWNLIPTYTVTYDGNENTGGSAPVDSNEYQEDDEVIVSGPGTLERDGYDFAGWDTVDVGGGDHYDPGDPLTIGTEDVILYAQWSPVPTYTVTYDGNENTGGEAPVDGNEYEEGQTVIVSGPGTLVRDGYEFVGWDTVDVGGGDHYDPGDPLTIATEDVILYAQWSLIPTYTVTYDGNGNDGGAAPVDGNTYYEDDEATVLDEGTLTLTDHEFVGWDTVDVGGGDHYDPGDPLTIATEDVILYAQWAPLYTVTYDANGGIGDPPVDPDSYLESVDVIVLGPGDLTRDGYDFAGWDTDPGGEGAHYEPDGILVMGSADVVLYAQWEVDRTASFASQWNTENTTSGSSGSEQVTLALESTGTYDFVVNWGDTNEDTILAWDDTAVTHTYDTPGTYSVAIYGVIQGFCFDSSGDRGKLVEISEWGPLRLGNSGHYFDGAQNLVITATDLPDLTGTTDMSSAFAYCDALTTVPNMGSWDVSAVTDMSYMFYYALAFDQDLGGWDVRNVADMTGMFEDSGLSMTNYDAALNGWAALSPDLQDNVTLGAGTIQHSSAATDAYTTLTTTHLWTINDGGEYVP
jgi:uncharacterized repeat protein (TIGR02543 family)